MYIRKATEQDIPRMMEIFALARAFMAEHGNPNQWAEDYPAKERLLEDIRKDSSFVCMEADRIVATFVLCGGADPTYDKIYDGAWTNGLPYATIHRIASSGEVSGIFEETMRFALQHYQTIRVDTHRDNVVMQQALEKMGFVYCGLIHCWNGDERLAYQYH